MSMHEYENLVEHSIRFLDRLEGINHIALFQSLYIFQSLYDTGITTGRVADILIKRNFEPDIHLKNGDNIPTIDPVDIASLIATHAKADSAADIELLSWWYAIIPNALLMGTSSKTVEMALQDPSIQNFHHVAVKLEAFKIQSDYGELCIPKPEYLTDLSAEDMVFMNRWYGPAWNFKK